MRNAAIAVATAILLNSCASASRIYGPDGKEAFSIRCGGLLLDWGMCYEKAGDLCGTKGYEVIGQSGDLGTVASVNPSGGVGGSVIDRNLLIKCRE